MKVEFWFIGKTAFPYLKEGIELYAKRLKHYLPFAMELIPDVKNAGKLAAEQLKQKEGEMILQRLKPEDALILLDEKGRSFTSVKFAQYLERKLQSHHRRIIFQVGGAYGFSEAVYQRATDKIALSEMTFSHQMVRLFFVEQLYRGMTILKGEKYHNK